MFPFRLSSLLGKLQNADNDHRRAEWIVSVTRFRTPVLTNPEAESKMGKPGQSAYGFQGLFRQWIKSYFAGTRAASKLCGAKVNRDFARRSGLRSQYLRPASCRSGTGKLLYQRQESVDIPELRRIIPANLLSDYAGFNRYWSEPLDWQLMGSARVSPRTTHCSVLKRRCESASKRSTAG